MENRMPAIPCVMFGGKILRAGDGLCSRRLWRWTPAPSRTLRDNDNAERRPSMAHGTQEVRAEQPRKGGLFDDLSATQVIAGALAAVTSMLLASQIGIAGSVIGVAVGSVVSAVASQLYKKFLAASAEKIKDLHPIEASAGAATFGPPADEAMPSEAAGQGESETAWRTDGETNRFDTVAVPAKTAVLPVVPRQSTTPSLDDTALQGDATVIRAKTMRRRKKQLQRRVAAVAAVSALVAVVVSAFLVNAVTDGQGIGAKVSPLPSIAGQSQSSDAGRESSSSEDDSAAQNGKAQDESASSSDDASKGADSDQSGSDASSGSGQAGGATDPSNPSGGSGGQGSGSGSDGGGTTGGGQESDGQGSGSGSGQGSGSGSGSGSDGGSGTGSGSTSGSGQGSTGKNTSGSNIAQVGSGQSAKSTASATPR